MKAALRLLFAVFATSVALAQAPQRQQPANITLTDGRSFANAKVVSQTPLWVTIKHPGGFTQVEKAKLPDELQKLYPPDKELADRQAEEDLYRREIERKREAERLQAALDARRASAIYAARAEEDDLAAAEKSARAAWKTAQAEAEAYFLHEWKPGNNSILVMNRRVKLDSVEPVAGWPNRWSVSGTAHISYYISSGSSLSNNTVRFVGELVGRKLELTVR